MTIKPLGDKVLVKPFAGEQVSQGGIIIPENAQEKSHKGTVIATGDGALSDSGERLPMTVKACDDVIFAKYTGSELTLDGEDYIILSESDIIAII